MQQKSIWGIGADLAEILWSNWEDAKISALMVVLNPSPVHFATVIFAVLSSVMFWSGAQKIMLHRELSR